MLCVCAVNAHAGSTVDVSVAAIVSPTGALQPGSAGTIVLTAENVGDSPALQVGFGFSQEFRGAGTPHITILSTRAPCVSGAFVADPLPGYNQVTGLSGSFGRLEPGQTATCTADFVVPPDVSGVTAVRVSASDLADINYTNSSVLLTLILGGVTVPVVGVPALVPAWNDASRWAAIMFFLIAGLVATRIRSRSTR